MNSKLTLLLVLPLLTLAITIYSGETSVIDKALIVYVGPPWDNIDPGTAECVLNALSYAEDTNSILILELDTYGGWLDSAFTIADAIYSARVPVIGYVVGGKALSAGTLVLLPTHVIVLSPNSVIGAMQPIIYDPLTGSVRYVNESKVLNPIIQKAIIYAEGRGRNTSVVEEFVRSNLVLSSHDAVKYGIADFVAVDLNELIKKVNGVEVSIGSNKYMISIKSYQYYTCGMRSRTLSLLTNPLVSSVLITVGIMALIFSIASAHLYAIPLALLFLILGLIGSGFNPNIASLIMLVLGALLLALEIFVIPGFGVTGIAGIIFLIFGILLMPSSVPTTLILTPEQILILRLAALSLGIVGGSVMLLMVREVVKIRRMRKHIFSFEGKVGRAIDKLTPNSYGYVLVEGEYWLAKSEEVIESGELVYVVRQEGNYLVVRKYVA
ncbi:MAG: ATP-dependent Clp protease proteolytic subunit [Desulfurococcaceae archaeon]|jgi:membrane-bound serine protease (ClpP class)|nr:ATP-dependent Clp protease proteolytic subunit [Desulfurococcaceae archaeon]